MGSRTFTRAVSAPFLVLTQSRNGFGIRGAPFGNATISSEAVLGRAVASTTGRGRALSAVSSGATPVAANGTSGTAGLASHACTGGNAGALFTREALLRTASTGTPTGNALATAVPTALQTDFTAADVAAFGTPATALFIRINKGPLNRS